MRGTIWVVCEIYSVLLLLYPRSLREAYGAEMTGVLRDQLREDGSWRAVAWTFLEAVVIGLPARLRGDIPAAAPLGVAASSAVLYGLLFVLHDSGPLDAFMRRWFGVHCP